jgi:hypothetical protein
MKTKMEYLCKCGVKNWATFDCFKHVHNCKKCGDKKTGDKLRTPKEEVFSFIKKCGFEVLSNDYFNNQTLIKVKCPKGHETQVRFGNFKDSRQCFVCYCSPKEHIDYDKNNCRHQLYNRRWRRAVKLKLNFTCQKCGYFDKKNQVHHLNSWHWDDENHFNVDNGSVLCSTHHKDFHEKYGRHFNTINQYNEWNPTNQILIPSLIEAPSKFAKSHSLEELAIIYHRFSKKVYKIDWLRCC